MTIHSKDQNPTLYSNCQGCQISLYRPSLQNPSFSFYSPTVTLLDDYFCSLFFREGPYSVRKWPRHSRVMKSVEHGWARNDYQSPLGDANRDSILTIIPSVHSDLNERGKKTFCCLWYLRESSDSLFIKCILILILLCTLADLQKHSPSLKNTKHNGLGKAGMWRKLHLNTSPSQLQKNQLQLNTALVTDLLRSFRA